ncbi:MAG TPA: hypothetical protein VKG23_02665 [Thermoanaerobaculia bacterium]|nr:hypothetical protein [Thermoanaerobaculia bacterium]
MSRLVRTPLPPMALEKSAPADGLTVDALIEQATALGIPWQRLLRSEIAAETTMRAFFVAIDGDWPLWSALAALPFGPLQSWRVRDRLEALSSEARSVGCQTSARQLRAVFRHLCGKSSASASAPALARHLWFAYQRVLVLQHIGRTARRTRGAFEERVADVVRRLACSRADAEWAVRREQQDDRSHLLDDAMQKARDEGFEIPRTTNEARAFRKLRSVARSSPHLVRWSSTNGNDGDPEVRS